MRFPPSFLDEIKARLPVSEVVRRRVKLVRAGREWRGLSPFNDEKTPSFFVNDQKGFFHDFSSGKHGSIFDFVMESEGLSFPEAVERLANEAGLALPTQSPESARREQLRTSLHETLEMAAAFFEAELHRSAGAAARAYLEGRGLAPALQRRFRLGYARDERFALRDALAAKGVGSDLMIEAGLLIHGEDIAVPYDRFRGRVMFPIADRSGRIIAFGGRALEKAAKAKYLNSPETTLFHKGGVLFNHHNARRAAQREGGVIAVEGYIDAIAMAGAGFENVVAPLGTALTAEHCELLWTMADEPILCFDGDQAGRRAADRAIDVALPLLAAGRSLRFAFLPDGLDPDDFLRAHGPGPLKTILDCAKPLVDALWTRESQISPLDTPERKAGFERRVTEKLTEIRDDSLRRYYRDEFADRLRGLRARRSDESPAHQRAPQRGGPGRLREQPLRGYAASAPSIGAGLARSPIFSAVGALPREATILILLFKHPGLLAAHWEELAELEFASRELASFRDWLMSFAHEAELDHAALLRKAQEAGLGPALARIESAAPLAAGGRSRPDSPDADAAEVLRQALILHRRSRALHKELTAAAVALGREPTETNLARLREIQAELAGLDGREAAVEGFGASSGRETGI